MFQFEDGSVCLAIYLSEEFSTFYLTLAEDFLRSKIKQNPFQNTGAMLDFFSWLWLQTSTFRSRRYTSL